MTYKQDQGSYKPQEEATEPQTITVQKYEKGELQLREFVGRKPGLSTELVPVLKQFTELGFSVPQLEGIVDVAFQNAREKGRNEKVKWFLQTIGWHYNQSYLESIPDNYMRFTQFLEFLGDVESLRADVNGAGDSMTYDLCFRLMHELGKERTELLLERLVGESESRQSRVTKGILALYRIRELLDESKKTGYTPETLLDLRRNEIDSSFFGNDRDPAD